MAFWGCQVKPTKEAAFVPPPEESKLHLSQACLAPGAPAGGRATVLLRVGEGEPLAVCALREGAAEGCNLDLVLDEYTEFSVQGNAAVHLTGYFIPQYEVGPGDMSDDDDDDDAAMLQNGAILGYDEFGVPVLADEYDSEEDSDYETEEEDSEDEGLLMDADGMFFSGEEDEDDSDDGSDEYDSADEGLLLSGRKSGVSITEITEEDAAGVPTVSNRPGKAAAFADDDVSGSDEEESESEEEEEAPKPSASAKNQPNGIAKAAAAATPAGAQKRKAEAAPAAAAAAEKKAKAAEDKAAKAAAQKAAAAEKKAKAAADKKAKAAAEKKGNEGAAPPSDAAGEVPSGRKHVRRFANGFEIEELAQGRPDGKLAKPGKKVSMRYVGRLKNGTVFDQTTGAKTFSFRLGVGEVIKGWDRGCEGMRVGDKRRLVVPPSMAYGSSRTGPIPPNSTLTFEVELVDVKG